MTGFLFLENGYSEINQFHVMALVDFRSIEFFLNDQESKGHTIVVEPNERSVVPVRVPKLPAGQHDVIFIFSPLDSLSEGYLEQAAYIVVRDITGDLNEEHSSRIHATSSFDKDSIPVDQKHPTNWNRDHTGM